MSMQHYNPSITPFMEVVDKDNGKGYSKNLPKNGMLISIPNSNTKMFYELKFIEGATIIFIRYIHYDNEKQLKNLLAFACQWWKSTKPNMIYMREKDRKNAAGRYLEMLGFFKSKIKNELEEFDCNVDGWPCHCNVFEYTSYNIAEKKPRKSHPKTTII